MATNENIAYACLIVWACVWVVSLVAMESRGRFKDIGEFHWVSYTVVGFAAVLYTVVASAYPELLFGIQLHLHVWALIFLAVCETVSLILCGVSALKIWWRKRHPVYFGGF